MKTTSSAVPMIVDKSSNYRRLALGSLTPERWKELIEALERDVIAKFPDEPGVVQAARVAINNLKSAAP